MHPVSNPDNIRRVSVSLSDPQKAQKDILPQEKLSPFFVSLNLIDQNLRERRKILKERVYKYINSDPGPYGFILVGWLSGALLGVSLRFIKPYLTTTGLIPSLLNHQHGDFGESTPMLSLGGIGAAIGMFVGFQMKNSDRL